MTGGGKTDSTLKIDTIPLSFFVPQLCPSLPFFSAVPSALFQVPLAFCSGNNQFFPEFGISYRGIRWDFDYLMFLILWIREFF
ncbi:hypothetical protein L2E82_13066 [Cichorium intybus]|uniref:Uncharacterized protein n=1 Tax=Cichorium intybus TaxID=13427 RepID=A0ACB9GHT7_CICIN|nr:hypothetical protein L2E82_13066 [Cichorium intybus]